MTENHFISFPTISKISVHNYPLFDYGEENSWTTIFENGLNLFLGANSIGKTTTINMVVYGIVGDFRNADNMEVNANFFQERLLPFEKNIQEQLIEVEFSIEKSVINIQRNLKRNLIERITVIENGQEKTIAISEYEGYIKRITKINDISDLAFVLSFLIIREEEGNYLLWQKDEQSKIFSILLNQAGFHKELTLLQNEFEEADNIYKAANEKHKLANERLCFFKNKQKEELANFNTILDIEIFRKQLRAKNEELTKTELILEEKKKKTASFQKIVESTKNEYSLKWNICKELENTQKKIVLEIEDFKDILTNIQFKSSTINLTKNKLINNKICTHCEAPLTAKKAEEILKIIVERNQCPVCSSELKYEKTDKTKEELIELVQANKDKLNLIEKQIEKANQDCKNLFNIKTRNDIAFTKLSDECIHLDKSIFNLSLEITSLSNKIFELSKNKKIEKTDYDLLIYKQEIEINEIQKEVSKYQIEQATKLNELRKKNDQFNNRIGFLTEEISTQFKKYASEYFKEQSSLESRTFVDKYGLKTVYFIPKVDNSERKFKNKVSQSERVFLEYLFRLAIIELYYEKSKHGAFLMLETSEGVFDVSNTGQVARLFSRFGGDKFPVVIFTNKSKEDFLKELNPKKTFDLIKFGKRLSDRQKKDLQGKIF